MILQFILELYKQWCHSVGTMDRKTLYHPFIPWISRENFNPPKSFEDWLKIDRGTRQRNQFFPLLIKIFKLETTLHFSFGICKISKNFIALVLSFSEIAISPESW